MFQKFTLAAAAVAFLALAIPAEAAMPGPAPGPYAGGYTTEHFQPVKAKKKHVIYVKRQVCGPVYKWRTIWWKGHPQQVKVKVGTKCHWKWVPIFRWK